MEEDMTQKETQKEPQKETQNGTQKDMILSDNLIKAENAANHLKSQINWVSLYPENLPPGLIEAKNQAVTTLRERAMALSTILSDLIRETEWYLLKESQKRREEYACYS